MNEQTEKSSVTPWLVVAAIAGLTVLYFVFAKPNVESGAEGPLIGTKMPILKLEPLTGEAKAVSLDDVAGQVALVNFWGTWCPPCRLEFPHMVDLEKRYSQESDFRLLAVSSGGGADEAAELDELRTQTEDYLKQEGADLATYVDANAATRAALVQAGQLDGFAFPTTVAIDRQGVIRGFWVGYQPGTEHEMRRLVDQLLAEQRSAPVGEAPAKP